MSKLVKEKKLKAKKGKLFLFIVSIIAIAIIVIDVIQVSLVSASSKKQIRADAELQYTELTEQTSIAIKNLVTTYFGYLDFYTNSAVAQTGDTQAIVKWLQSPQVVSHRRPVFKYIGYVDSNGVNWTDNGAKSNVGDREYYRKIMSGGLKNYIDNPSIARTTGLRVFHVCQALTIDGKNRGLFYGVIDPSAISAMLKEINLGELGNLAVMGSNGDLIGTNHDDAVFEKSLAVLKKTYPKSYAEVALSWGDLSKSSMIELVDENGKQQLMISYPIPGTTWKLMMFLNLAKVLRTASMVTNFMVAGAFILVVLIITITAAVLYRSIKPLTVVENTIRGIATGDADLTKRIDINSNNEIGRVVDEFNLFAAKLQDIIATMKTSKAELVDVGELLSNSTEDTISAITQIISNIESMSKEVNFQTDSVSQTAGAVNQIAANIESLNRMIESQSSSIEQASSAVEEMIGNINAVNSSVQKMANSFTELEEKTAVGVQRQNDVNIKIEEIQKESQALQEANAVISGIAEQTNLLAMNAAIEAAHAGEAGKGFSVVADEIRKLSEDSSAQSQSIGNQLTNISSSIQSIVEASQIAADAFSEVMTGINGTTNLVREITNAMMEQNAGSKQISIALNNMNDTSNEVKTSSFEMAEGNKAILNEIKNLQEATFTIKDGMTEMSAGARKINETGAALSDLTHQMDDSIKKIGLQVDQFTV